MLEKEQEILADLLAEWECAQAKGEDISPEQLCETYPDLLEPLRESIQLLAKTQWMTESSSSMVVEEPNEQTISVDEVVRRIQEFNLLPRQDSESLTGISELSAEQLTGDLVEQGKLTLYQKKSLLGVNHFPLVIDRYTIVDFLGAGGMGIVFKARHRELNRMVAIKTVAIEPDDTHYRLERFVREIKSLAQLTHPNIVGAHDALTWHGQLYLVMEYAEGKDLGNLIRNQGALSPEESVTVIAQMANAIRFAHQCGIIHRDIKPANIVVSSDGGAKLLDLGLAKIKSEQVELTKASGVVGTPHFVAPEMLEDGVEVSESADIYALGCTLFYALSGRPPFERDSPIKTLLAHQRDPIPELPIELEHRDCLEPILRKMMAKDARSRPTAAELEEDLLATQLIQSTINIYRQPEDEMEDRGSTIPRPAVPRIQDASPNSISSKPMKRLVMMGWVFAALSLLTLTILLVRQSIVPSATAAESLDRKLAKWVLSYESCAVEIRTDVGLQTTDNLDSLPATEFKITGIQLYAPTDSPDFGALAKLSDLEWISLSDFEEGEIEFSGMVSLKRLKKLYLENCVIDNQTLEAVAKLVTLETLDLSFSTWKVERYPDAGLTKLDGLRELLLADVRLSDQDLAGLKIPATIESLDVQENSLTPESLPILQQFTSLRNLAIGGNGYGDECIELLSALPSLIDLHIARSPITNRFLQQLIDFKSIRSLHIYGVNADDAWVDALLRLDQLTELDIADNDFSDVGMLRFSGMKNLRSLTVGGLDSVSEATLDKLQDLMPHCEFYE